ncbi:MAG TPA: hypothetical protein PLQ36_02405 [Candidatus Gracilibacteria bacterium]|nr:hypothetical protein [Candidatus Gracilibacteria bacterium]
MIKNSEKSPASNDLLNVKDLTSEIIPNPNSWNSSYFIDLNTPLDQIPDELKDYLFQLNPEELEKAFPLALQARLKIAEVLSMKDLENAKSDEDLSKFERLMGKDAFNSKIINCLPFTKIK